MRKVIKICDICGYSVSPEKWFDCWIEINDVGNKKRLEICKNCLTHIKILIEQLRAEHYLSEAKISALIKEE
jgi:hypothetical protein